MDMFASIFHLFYLVLANYLSWLMTSEDIVIYIMRICGSICRYVSIMLMIATDVNTMILCMVNFVSGFYVV